MDSAPRDRSSKGNPAYVERQNGQRVTSMKREVSSSAESRLEKKKSMTRSDAGTLQKEGLQLSVPVDMRDDEIKDLKGELEKLKRSCMCVICQDLLFESFFLQCGHVYCYGVSHRLRLG